MAKVVMNDAHKRELEAYLKKNRKSDLVCTYLFYLEKAHHLQPVIYPAAKTIYSDENHAVEALESEGMLWREAEIKISFDQGAVNENTQKVYICPYSGKAFGDNTHPNPQDAIYDWVSRCPENKDRSGGLPTKRFFVSEDPEVIKNYITQRKKAVTKKVFTSVPSGKLFSSKAAVIEDFKKNYLRHISLVEAQSQNRFQLHFQLLDFMQKQLQDEENVSYFVDELSKINFFKPFVKRWLESDDSEVEQEDT